MFVPRIVALAHPNKGPPPKDSAAPVPPSEGQPPAAANAAAPGVEAAVLRCIGPDKRARQRPFFECPPWAAVPRSGLFLEATKGERLVGTLDIDACPYYLLGRAEKVVDFRCEHASISRSGPSLASVSPPTGGGPPPPQTKVQRTLTIGLMAESAHGGGIQSIGTDHCCLSLQTKVAFDNCSGIELKETFGTVLTSNDRIPVS